MDSILKEDELKTTYKIVLQNNLFELIVWLIFVYT